MQKKRSRQEIFQQLESPELRAVIGGGRLRVPGGDPAADEPIDEEGSVGVEAEHARIFVPGG